MENALIHIYTGDGKGKTTAAVGLCYRAAQRGFKVMLTSFLKDFDSGEYMGTSSFEIYRGTPVTKFWFAMSDAEKDSVKSEHKARLTGIFERAVSGGYDLIALDEIIGSIAVGAVNESDLLELLNRKPATLEVVLTGRDPSPALCEIADYISEIKAVKHPYDKGVMARVGIEK